VVDYLPHLERFWIVNSQIADSAILAVLISREEIEQQLTAPFEQLILRLQVSRDVVLSAQGKVDMFIGGYDNDPRELYEIPEVRCWIAKAVEQVRYLAWFFDMGARAQGMIIIPPCVCRFERPDANTLSIELEDLWAFVEKQFNNLNELADRFSLPEDLNEASSRAICRKVGIDHKS
jgi:hypothetical protein